MKRYHMQKADRELTDKEEVLDIIRRGKYCTLALSKDDEPYILTLSYGFDEPGMGLYFHTALKGKKLDFIESNERVCGTVIEDLGYKPGECSHWYRSAVFYGRIREVVDIDEMKKGMMTMFRHLEDAPDKMRERFLAKDADYDHIKVLCVKIEEVHGKGRRN